MIIFISLLIPFITAGILWYKFHHKMAWWEWAIPFVASLTLGILLYVFTSFVSCRKIEYLTNYVVKIEYYEDWNEHVTYTVRVKSGKSYITKVRTRIDYHPEYYRAIDNEGRSYSISKNKYLTYQSKWNNSVFIELNRRYHTNDGDMYASIYNGRDNDMWVLNRTQGYQNKIVATRSVFSFQKVSASDQVTYGVFDYPDDSSVHLLGEGLDQFPLAVLNARLGFSSEIRVWLLLFKNQPEQAGDLQEHHWFGGNMNELVMCINTDSENKITWAKTFSWCDNNSFTVGVRHEIEKYLGQKLDNRPYTALLDHLYKTIPTDWKRKDFEKDFDYITIDTPIWAIIITFIFTVALNLGISWLVITNEIH